MTWPSPSAACSVASEGSISVWSVPAWSLAGSSSGTPTARTSCEDTGPDSPSTETSPSSTGASSSPLTFWPVDSLASPSATPASGSGRTMSGGSGPRSPVRFAHFDPDTSSWRTSQLSWGEDSSTSSPTWPRSGMTRNGTAFRLPPLAPRTSATGSGSWPTPSAAVRNLSEDPEVFLARREVLKERHHNGNGAGMPLEIAVKLWPTPRAMDGRGAGPGTADETLIRRGPEMNLPEAVQANERGLFPTPMRADGERQSERMMRGNPTLLGAARMWPTPRASEAEHSGRRVSNHAGQTGIAEAVNETFRTPSSRDWKGMSAESRRSRSTGDPTPTLPDQVGGQLNPTWVEWLMGFPTGWTDCGHSETRSCRRSLSGSDAASLPSMREG